jgi:hypothetical protein
VSKSPDPRTLKICKKELAKMEKEKKKGNAPADIEAQMARYRELIRRLS